jgi:hypothetical protein
MPAQVLERPRVRAPAMVIRPFVTHDDWDGERPLTAVEKARLQGSVEAMIASGELHIENGELCR